MRFETAIEHLVDNYRYAKGKVWIRDEVAWALYQTWKEADRKTENNSEIPNNCEPQTEDKHAVCTGCDYYDLPNAFHPCASCVDFSKFKPKIEDEPQTERSSE